MVGVELLHGIISHSHMLSGSTLKPLTDSPPSEFTLILSRRGLKVSWGIVAGVGGGGGWNVAPFD